MRLPAACLAACLALGCTTASDDQGPGDRTQYPAGPYGTATSQIIAPLEFVDPDGQAIGLADLFADPHNRLLIISTSAGWCSACIKEQPKLQALHEEFGDRGLVVLVALFEDANFEPSTPELARRWREKYDLTLRVVADPAFKLGDYYDRTLTPMTLIVDVDDMKILRNDTGFDEGAVRAIVESKL